MSTKGWKVDVATSSACHVTGSVAVPKICLDSSEAMVTKDRPATTKDQYTGERTTSRNDSHAEDSAVRTQLPNVGAARVVGMATGAEVVSSRAAGRAPLCSSTVVRKRATVRPSSMAATALHRSRLTSSRPVNGMRSRFRSAGVQYRVVFSMLVNPKGSNTEPRSWLATSDMAELMTR